MIRLTYIGGARVLLEFCRLGEPPQSVHMSEESLPDWLSLAKAKQIMSGKDMMSTEWEFPDSVLTIVTVQQTDS